MLVSPQSPFPNPGALTSERALNSEGEFATIGAFV